MENLSTGKLKKFKHSSSGFSDQLFQSSNIPLTIHHLPTQVDEFYDELQLIVRDDYNGSSSSGSSKELPHNRTLPKKLKEVDFTDDKSRALILEYESSLNRIEACLAEKEFDVTRRLKQMTIRLQEKDRFAQEKCRQYQLEIEKLQKAIILKNQRCLELEKKFYEFLTQNQNLKNQIQFIQQSEKTKQNILQQQIEDLNRKLTNNSSNDNRQKQNVNKRMLEKEIESLKFQIERVCFEKDYIQELDNKEKIIQNREHQIQELKQKIKIMEQNLGKYQKQMSELKQFKILFSQNQSVLEESQQLHNIMEKELTQLRVSLKQISFKNEDLRCKNKDQSVLIDKLRFQKNTLTEYNKVLISKLEKGGFKQMEKSNSTFQTIEL